jgi:uncharacterized protein YndB with AHSA1/START domain
VTKSSDAPIAEAQMLIRKPVAKVFEAMVDPAITSRFWFSLFIPTYVLNFTRREKSLRATC